MMLITYCKFLYLGICMCLVTTGYHGIDNLVTTGYHCIDNLVKQRCCLCLNLYYIFMFTLYILKAEIMHGQCDNLFREWHIFYFFGRKVLSINFS